MFTGIITDIGRIRSVERRGEARARIGTAYDTGGIDVGASIACDGACLTIVALGPDWFEVEISAETASKTNLDRWHEGRGVNLERALRVGDELGGHIVSGHVDGLARITGMREEGGSLRVSLSAPEALARFIAPKGSVALDGVSLTVNEVQGCRFGVNLIPHTLRVTTWGAAAPGEDINLEIDTMARYVARLAETSGMSGPDR